ncbi:hypothetical protein AB4059_00355 [Lysobacter sp. 2RAF19]
MTDVNKQAHGQASALLAGVVMLLLGGSSLLESIRSGTWVFRYRSQSFVSGNLALALVAISLFAGSYLALSAIKRLRE